MDFQQAMDEVDAGGRIRREAWTDDRHLEIADDGRLIASWPSHQDDPTVAWLSGTDLMAHDWRALTGSES